MKLSDCITDYKMTGGCEIDVKKVIKCFGKKSYICRNHEYYRLVNDKVGVKVSISAEAANEIIKALELPEYKSPIFSDSSTYRYPILGEPTYEEQLALIQAKSVEIKARIAYDDAKIAYAELAAKFKPPSPNTTEGIKRKKQLDNLVNQSLTNRYRSHMDPPPS